MFQIIESALKGNISIRAVLFFFATLFSSCPLWSYERFVTVNCALVA